MVNKIPAATARMAVIAITDRKGIVDSIHVEEISPNRNIQVLQMIAKCNQTLLRAAEEKSLLQELCRIMVDTGKYQMAWIGFPLPDERKKARRYSQMCFEAGYPLKAQATWSHSKQMNTPVQTAMRTGRPAIVQDILSQQHTTGWQNNAAEHNFAAVISLPLVSNSQTFGTLNLYAAESKAFDSAETSLLIQLAEDVSYGIHSLRLRQAQDTLMQQLYTSEKYFHALIENASDIIMVLDQEGNTLYISPSVKRILGYAPEELTGKKSILQIQPENISSIQTLFQARITEKDSTGNIEARMQHIHGTWLYFDCSIVNKLHDPEIKGIVITLHDITLRKTTEIKLQKQQQEQEIIFDAVPAIISFKDAANRILRVNKRAASFFGLPKEQLEGMSMYTINPVDAARYHQEDLEIINSGIARLNVIEQVSFANGEVKWIQTDKIPYYDAEKKASGIVIFAQEVTAHKKMEEALTKTLEELKLKNYELDSYFYKVSHDIRSPLCSILGLTNLIKLEKDAQANEYYISLIEKSIHKLDSFIQTILNHSRTLNASTQVSSIDFEMIINECLKEFHYLPQAARLQTKVQVQSSNNFYNDQSRIAIVFRHLISNAIKYMDIRHEENLLNIDITITSNKAYISVDDNGTGIQKQYVSKIYDMFFKATDKSDGAGLGLYIVKQTIDKLGGSISVKSESGKGTSFKIILTNFGQ